MNSSRPYLVRAIYDWIVDNELTPYLLVDAEQDSVYVPRQYISNGKIILNIAPAAVQELDLGNEQVSFRARFNGQSMDVSFPVAAALAIYAKENGRGMVFSESDENPEPPDDGGDGDKKSKVVPARKKEGKQPKLRVVK